ncbi:MAG: phosphopantetheine-binding protein [bacterium]
MESSTQQRVIEIVLATAGLNSATQVTAETQLLNGGLSLDSVVVLELLLALEKEFKIELNAQELFEAQALKTVSSLAGFVDKKLG